MGADEYHPMSHEGTNLTEAGGIGYTVVDSLDTMLIMGLDQEYHRAKNWVEKKLSFDVNGSFSTFEVSNYKHHQFSIHLLSKLKLNFLIDNYTSPRRTFISISSYESRSYPTRKSYRPCKSNSSRIRNNFWFTFTYS